MALFASDGIVSHHLIPWTRMESVIDVTPLALRCGHTYSYLANFHKQNPVVSVGIGAILH